jgi:hypothetical protein
MNTQGAIPKKGVKKAKLILISSGERVLMSWTTHQSHLRARSKDISRAWGAYPQYQSGYIAEDKDISRQWGGAPP